MTSFEVISNGQTDLLIDPPSIRLNRCLYLDMKCSRQFISIRLYSSTEVMLLHSMISADDQLKLTNRSLDEYLSLTDESILDQISSIGGTNSIAAALAKDYRERRLLKCVYEKFLHKRDRFYGKMDRQALRELGYRYRLAQQE